MFFITLKRIIKSGVISFWRNRWVSLATILVMVLALFMVGALLFSNVLLSSALSRLEDKVDISIYFRTDAPESEIKNLLSSLSGLPQVKEVEYVSREQALEDFKKRHQNNSLVTRSLDELEDNPLGASLNVKAKDLGQYEAIARFFEAGIFSSIIDKVNYFHNQLIIDRLSGILGASRQVGMGASAVLALVAVFVVFNTIRLAIYTNREEISVMRLVGAKNNYIRGPYIVEGVLYGVIAAVSAMIIFYPLTLWLGPQAERFFGGPDLFSYYLENFFEIFAILLFVGVFLGVISGWIAVKRYLKI